ncbi:MAG: CsbD family protein [Sinimarinibacterium sp.]|jgi:uncharacterized protein YjbJ (UPF0337 family)
MISINGDLRGCGVEYERDQLRRIQPILSEPLMNKDQVKGQIKQAKGQIKNVAGKILGDRTMQAKGKIQDAAGKIQEGYGDLKADLKQDPDEKR